MATEKQITSLVDFDTSYFAEHYQQGLRWFLFEQCDHTGPLSDEDIVATFKCYTYAGLFDGEQEQSLSRAVGAYLGMIHAGVLSPETVRLRPGVTALAAICNREAARGYGAGREWFFVDAEPHETRYSESGLLERLRESVLEMAHWQDRDSTWFFSIGCLLGELSGQLFPMNAREQQAYLPQLQRLEDTRQRYGDAQKRLAPSGMRLPVL